MSSGPEDGDRKEQQRNTLNGGCESGRGLEEE